jgi:hypothetical protein
MHVQMSHALHGTQSTERYNTIVVGDFTRQVTQTKQQQRNL